MIRKMTVIGIVRFVLVLTVCVAAIFLSNAAIFALGDGLIQTLRHLLPLKGLTAVACMYLINFISISVVAFVSGLFHWVSFNMIRSGVIAYIIWDWLGGMKHCILIWKVTGCFSFLPPIIMTISDVLLLLLVLISLKRIHKAGRRLRGVN
jgi:hypothetical protein